MNILLIDNSKPDLALYTPILIAELSKYANVHSCKTRIDVLSALQLKKWDAAILSGSSLNLSDSLNIQALSKNIMVLLYLKEVPILGICFGMQLISCVHGGKVIHMNTHIRGDRFIHPKNSMLCGSASFIACLSHGDAVESIPGDFSVCATHEDNIDVFEHCGLLRFGVQFHPERRGQIVLERFLKFTKNRYELPIHLSDPIIKEIEQLIGLKSVPKMTQTFDIDRTILLEIWNVYRVMNDIPAILV